MRTRLPCPARPTAWGLTLGLAAFGAALGATPAFAEPALPPEAVDRVLEQVEALKGKITELRGLPFVREVPVSLEDGDQVRAHMLEDLDEPENAPAIESFAATMALFRFGPDDLDVRNVYADILGESVAGYYDPDERRLVLVVGEGQSFTDGLPAGSAEATTAAHELVHTLQDQTFDLWTLQDRDFHDDDVEMALSGLIEGDATFAMLLHDMPALAYAPQLLDLGKMLEAMGGGEAAAPPGSALAKAPPIFMRSLVFPYVYGMTFARDAWTAGGGPQGGWARVDAAFRNPPMSTEQILHPEKFLGERPDWPLRLELDGLVTKIGTDPAAPTLPGAWRHVDTNTLGEAGIRWLLLEVEGAKREDVEAAADGWGGDRYAVWRGEDGGVCGVWVTTWDDEAHAREFRVAADAWVRETADLKGKARATGWTTWQTDDGRAWALGALGKDVVLLMDVPSAAVPGLQAATAGLPRRPLTRLDDVAPVKGTPREVDAAP